MAVTVAAPAPDAVAENVARALAEDLGAGDCTAALIPADARLETRVISRESAVLCGAPWFTETFRQLEAEVTVSWQADEGAVVHHNQEVCRLEGPARAVLSGERTALNFLQTLSGTATLARRYVDAVAGTGATILDTRKTVPGLRIAQKYAVRCGGASNHRVGLFDAILVKENHISAAGSISAAVREALRRYPELPLEVEVEDTDQLEEAMQAGARRVLLDNFSLRALKAAVERYHGRVELEASGGIELQSVRAVAETGVDYISAGDLTKNVDAIDFSMRFLPM